MPLAPDAMWILTLFHLALLVSAGHNYTIDDASPLITYDAPVLERNHTSFDSHLLWDGTITYVAPASNFSPTISIPFNGTAIYIFVAYPGITQPAPSGFNASIDGAPTGNWAADESALLYHHLVYHTAGLPAAPHTLVMQINPRWELYFDYAIYTSDMDPPSSISTSSTGAAQPTSFTTESNTAKKPPLGAIIGAVLGGTLLVTLSTAMFFRCRRRAAEKRRRTAMSLAAGFSLSDEWSEGEEAKTPGPPAMPFLLRAAPPTRSKIKSVNRLSEGSGHTGVTSERGLARLTAEIQHLTASVQQLGTGIPDARDGGQVMQLPPAYGNSG
ncbi:hypothetical protein C8F04DRAFT_1239397 [Mycena alexandri]|uniref:Uncharacterized protein n=1 Tax=Mycena alexandri TaxID=1745969 RepID=A0AAD6SBV4_9AGAR|nr:hypothetical protein C8F04DRAFT_1239397 [Mycena alexandri]